MRTLWLYADQGMPMTRYRSKPTECEAMQWPRWGARSFDVGHRIIEWVNANGGEARYEPAISPEDCVAHDGHAARIAIRTADSWVYAAPGDTRRDGRGVVPSRRVYGTGSVCPRLLPVRPGDVREAMGAGR